MVLLKRSGYVSGKDGRMDGWMDRWMDGWFLGRDVFRYPQLLFSHIYMDIFLILIRVRDGGILLPGDTIHDTGPDFDDSLIECIRFPKLDHGIRFHSAIPIQCLRKPRTRAAVW